MKKESEKTIFAKNLCKAIEEAKVTHDDLSKVLGITRQAVTQFCNGSAQPSIDKLRKIANALRVSSDYLLGLTGVESNNNEDRVIHDALGLSDKAIAALKLSRLTYQTKTERAEKLEAKLMKELEQREHDSLKALVNSLKASRRTAMLEASVNTIPCIEILLRQRATEEKPRVLDLLLTYFNFEEQDFVAQSLSDFIGNTKEKAAMIDGKRMSAYILDEIKDALRELKEERKSEGNK